MDPKVQNPSNMIAHQISVEKSRRSKGKNLPDGPHLVYLGKWSRRNGGIPINLKEKIAEAHRRLEGGGNNDGGGNQEGGQDGGNDQGGADAGPQPQI